MSEREIDRHTNAYSAVAAACAALDESVEAAMAALERRGVLDNTVVIFLSDNGYLYGEHRLTGKGVPYEEAVFGALRIRYPGAADRSSPALVSLVDIAPTIYELANIEPSVTTDGMSLVPLLQDPASDGNWRDDLLVEWPAENPFNLLRHGSWKWIEWSSGERELYHMEEDPFELTNLANEHDYQTVSAEMSARLAAIVG